MPENKQAELDSSDSFPPLSLDLLGGGSLLLPTEERTLLLIDSENW